MGSVGRIRQGLGTAKCGCGLQESVWDSTCPGIGAFPETCLHSRFQNPIWLKNTLFCPSSIFAPSSPPHHFFASPCHSLYSTTTNERTNAWTIKRTNERWLPHSHVMFMFAHHYWLFAFCIVHLSFGTRSTTTMTTTLKTTTMPMQTPQLLHVALKSSFKIFKCKKTWGNPWNFFFASTHLVHSRFVAMYR
jgi:hypothetical protein